MKLFLVLLILFFSLESFSQVDYRNCSKIFKQNLVLDENSKLVLPKDEIIKSQNSSNEFDSYELLNKKTNVKEKLILLKDSKQLITKVITGSDNLKDFAKEKSDKTVGIEADFEFFENKCFLKRFAVKTYIADKKEIKITEELTREDCIKSMSRMNQCNKAKLNCPEELERLPKDEIRKMLLQVKMMKGDNWKLFFSEGILKGSESFQAIYNHMFVCSDKFRCFEDENYLSKDIDAKPTAKKQ